MEAVVEGQEAAKEEGNLVVVMAVVVQVVEMAAMGEVVHQMEAVDLVERAVGGLVAAEGLMEAVAESLVERAVGKGVVGNLRTTSQSRDHTRDTPSCKKEPHNLVAN